MKRTFSTALLATLLFFQPLPEARQNAVSAELNDDLPTVSLMVWYGIGKEGSHHAELRLYQVGKKIPGLKVNYEITGTARNGFDFTNTFSTKVMKENPTSEIFDDGFDYTLIDPKINVHVSTPIMIDPIDDSEKEGDETVTITLLPSPDYKIDPKNTTKTVIIQDNEIPDVHFARPASAGGESVTSPKINLTFSRPATEEVTVQYIVTGLMAEPGKDYDMKAGTLTIPAGTKTYPLPLAILDDKVAEDDETVVIEITKTTGANIGINERYTYTIVNDDGEVPRSVIHDRIYGAILGSRAGSSLGAIPEMIVDMDQIEKLYGTLDTFIPYVHNRNIAWVHPAGGTEDGIERHKLLCTAIIEKQDRVNAEDVRQAWIRHFDVNDAYFLTQPYDRVLARFAKWGVGVEGLPVSKFGTPYDLGEHIHLTARSFQPIPCINAGDPEGAIEDMKDVGRIYYEHDNDEAYAWGAVFNTAMTLAMMPGATVDSVIEGAMKKATPAVRKELEIGLAIAEKYKGRPMAKGLRRELNEMYGNPSSPYFANTRIPRYVQSSIFENVTCAFVIFKVTEGDLRLACIVATNRGRDSDCAAASSGALAGAFSGTTKIPSQWIHMLEVGNRDTPYTNSHMTNKATADALYRALQNKLRRMKKEVEQADKLTGKLKRQKKYIEKMESLGVI